MVSLLLAKSQSRTPAEIVSWFGAMQAQDLASGEWSFGVRSPTLTQADVHQATLDRQILRTWPMRGTVHFVTPRDAKWMLDLTGVRALAGAPRRRAQLGLSERDVIAASEVLRTALTGGKRLTRRELVGHLVESGHHTASEHGYHFLWYASQIGVSCIGPQGGKEQTFVLLEEWVPNPRVLGRDEALAELALRYFQSHGPTTMKDFAGWSGLAMGDARKGLDGAGRELTTMDVDGVTYVLAPALLDEASTAISRARRDEVLLLPGFDEYMLGFKDRSLMLPDEHKQRIVPGSNGVFMPTIVADGRVIGTWKREVKKGRVDVRAAPFEPFTAVQRAAFERAGDRYGRYLQLDTNYPE